MALKQPNPRPQFLLKIALAFLVFFGFSTAAQTAQASFLDDVLSLPSQLAEGAQIAATEVFPSFFDQASLTSVFNDIQCFFGFGCAEIVNSQNPTTNNQIADNHQPSTSNQNSITDNLEIHPESQITAQPESPKPPIQITQIINPTKEIQTIHTVTNNTNTVVVDTETKNQVNQLLRQLNSDRPNYSTGQTVSLPANLVSKTLNITSGDFNVDENGNVTANDITSNGNLTVQGNFAVSGSQTYSGSASFSATSTTPALLVEQTGSGNALQADNVTIKDSMIATDNGGTLQFQTANNYLDTNGNLVLEGDITAGKYNGLTINPTTKSLTVSNDATVSGTNTGDQTITLTGDITGSGNGSFATTIGNTKVTNAMLAGSIAASKLIGTDIATVGTITTGVWNGTTISPAKGGTGIANGTNNTITFTGNYTLGLTLSANTSLTLPSSGTLATTSDKLNAFASTSSSELSGTISDETGSGSLVFATSPTFTTQLTTPKVVGDTTGLYLNEDGGAGIFVKDGGNIGIGTTNPSSKLDVTGDIRISSGSGGQIIFADGSTMASSGLGSAAALSNTTDAIMTGDSDANNTGAVIFKTGSNDRLHILNNGNVGIGTATPGYPLDVESASFSNGIISLFKTSGNTDTAFQVQNSVAAWQFSVRESGDSNPGGFNFYYSPNGSTGWVNALNLGTGGNVSIPTGILTASGAGNNSFVGNVGIGTATPNTKLDVRGGINAGTNGTEFTLSSSGAVVAVTYNGLTINPTTGILSIANTKTLTVSNDATVSGTNTGDQTITLTGDITGSGTASFATTIGNAKVTNTMLAGSIAANKLIGTDIATVGTITTGTWNGSIIPLAYGGTGTATGSITGTGALTFAAGGSNQNVTLTPSGTGYTVLNGNVGVGTAVPGEKLEINGNIKISTAAANGAGLEIYSNGQVSNNLTLRQGWGTATDNIGYLYNRANADLIFGTNNSEKMRILAGGNLGIGTISPGAKLDVTGGRIIQAGSAAVTGYLETNSGMLASTTALNPGILVYGGDGANSLYGMDLGYNSAYRTRFITGGSNADFAFGYHAISNPTLQSQFTELMTIKGSGNVGIGTTSPGALLQVGRADTGNGASNGEIVIGKTDGSTSERLFKMGLDSNYHFSIGDYGIAGAEAYSPFMTIKYDSGNVGIGTTTPTTKTEISYALNGSGLQLTSPGYDGDSLNAGLRFHSTSNTGQQGDVVFYHNGSSPGLDIWGYPSNNSPACCIDIVHFGNNGNVGFGTSTPSYQVDVASSARIGSNAKTDCPAGWDCKTFTFDISAASLYINGINYRSDSRLKKNILYLENSLKKVMDLKGISYEWKQGTPGIHFGFVAQEMEEVFPELVLTDNNGFKSIDYTSIIPLTVEAIKEQQLRINDLKLQLNNLGLVDSTNTADIDQADVNLFDWLARGLKSLGLVVENGIASLKGIVAETFTGNAANIKKIQTEQMCIAGSDGQSVCIDKDQLKDLIQKAGSSVTINHDYQAPSLPAANGTTTEAGGQ